MDRKRCLTEGTVLHNGIYRIERFISCGGFGCTYEASHIMLDKRVAIKEFFVKDFCNRNQATGHVTTGIDDMAELVDKLRRKFIDEAKILSRLSHPGIVHVTDVFEENGTAYYVMDYIEGQSLAQMASRKPIPTPIALGYIRQVCDALKYLHGKSLLHLDIKPANIMVDEQGNAILIDFGAAKQYYENDGENLSTVMGKTPGYSPIEQMGNNVVKFLPATDIYALGATAYKVLTGLNPPSANQIASGEETIAFPTNFSQHIQEAIEAAMQVNKNERPQSVDEFLEMLDDDDDATELDAEDSHLAPKYNQPKKAAPTQTMHNKVHTAMETIKKEGNAKVAFPKWVLAACAAMIVGVIIFFMVPEIAEAINEDDEMLETVTDYPFINSHGVQFTYTGPVNEQGEPHGKGIGKYKDGTYEGEYVNGIKQGKALYATYDGINTFEGIYVDDKYFEGTLLYNDDSYYVGTFHDNKFYNGKFYDTDGTVYVYSNGMML